MNEILSAAYNRATTKNYLYTRHRDRWLFLLNSYVGGDEYRKGAYLTRYQLESDSDYNQRLINTPLDNQCKSIISLYISFLFREEPDRDLGSLETSQFTPLILEDADLDGRSMNAFMKDVAIWSQVFGHTWVAVAKPDIGATTAADEIAAGVRPYMSVLTPLSVVDWTWSRSANGSYSLSMIRYIEEMNDTSTTIKEWTRDIISTTVIALDREEATDYYEEVNGLGVIPFVLVYSERSPTRGVGLSIISDVADQQRAEYNEMSEVEQSIRLDSHPSLVATGETEVGTGAGALIRLPENLDPNLKPYVLEFSGASVESIYNSIAQRRQMIDSMTNVGSVRATETREMSGIAIETDFQLLNARLSSLADNLELAEEGIWQWIAYYYGLQWDGEIEYPSNFAIRNTDNELQRLVSAKAAVTDVNLASAIDTQIAVLLGLDFEETSPVPEVLDVSEVETDISDEE